MPPKAFFEACNSENKCNVVASYIAACDIVGIDLEMPDNCCLSNFNLLCNAFFCTPTLNFSAVRKGIDAQKAPYIPVEASQWPH